MASKKTQASQVIPFSSARPRTLRWGKARANRGVPYVEAAFTFAQQFPPGSLISWAEFETWAIAQELLSAPKNTKKQSPEWITHVQRRNHLKDGLNRAARHSRMHEAGFIPYEIVPFVKQKGLWEVRAAHWTSTAHEALAQSVSIVETKRIHLLHVLQSMDPSQVPPLELLLAETTCDDMTDFKDGVRYAAQRLNQKIVTLAQRLVKYFPEGNDSPYGSIIRALIEAPVYQEELPSDKQAEG